MHVHSTYANYNQGHVFQGGCLLSHKSHTIRAAEFCFAFTVHSYVPIRALRSSGPTGCASYEAEN